MVQCVAVVWRAWPVGPHRAGDPVTSPAKANSADWLAGWLARDTPLGCSYQGRVWPTLAMTVSPGAPAVLLTSGGLQCLLAALLQSHTHTHIHWSCALWLVIILLRATTKALMAEVRRDFSDGSDVTFSTFYITSGINTHIQ